MKKLSKPSHNTCLYLYWHAVKSIEVVIILRTRGTVGTEGRWGQRTRGTVGTEDQWVQRTRGPEEQWVRGSVGIVDLRNSG